MDSFGNGHELDYVLERGGTPEKVGTPVAFIESAWRRYTKHSRNKAQEIQGAVLPLAVKHHFSCPMLGCILAGVYMAGALDQLKSVGFKVLYFSYESVVEAFAAVGVDARSDESTPDAVFAKRLKKWKLLSEDKKISVGTTLLELNAHGVQEFLMHLERAVKRQITFVRITPLHGSAKDCVSVQEAVTFIDSYDEAAAAGPLVKYEILIRYDNGDKIDGEFHDKVAAVEFLQAYQTGNWTPAVEIHEEDVE